MSYPSGPHDSAVQAGWYPDPSGESAQRWWDGNAWTNHIAGAAPASVNEVYAPGSPPRRLDPSTPLGTPFIWLIVAVLPLLSLLTLLVWDVTAYISSSLDSSSDPLAQYRDPGYLLSQVSSWLFYGLTVLFAFFDWRILRRRGVDRPFHWAWSFLGGIVYVIGRSVVVQRRAGRGLAPLWVYIGVTVVSIVVVVVKVVEIFSATMSAVSTL